MFVVVVVGGVVEMVGNEGWVLDERFPCFADCCACYYGFYRQANENIVQDFMR